MKRIFILLSLFTVYLSLSLSASADEVIRLQTADGTGSEYSVAELLRVELNGDYIRFIAQDGTPAAEVYKYDYAKLTVEDKPSTAVAESRAESQELTARKVIMNGQVYILFGDKLYNITGNKIQ